MANILVTGGAGYIGSHTCKHLKSLGHTPVALDNLSRGFQRLVKWGPFIEGDIFQMDLVASTLLKYQIDAVIHFAAFAYVGESVEKPEMYMQNNLYGSIMLFEAMKAAGIKNILVSSTCAVYGESQQDLIDENHPTLPINPYGLSKKMVEEILAKYEFNSCRLRYFNAAGADPELETGECHDPEPHILPNLLRQALSEQPVHLFGNDYPTKDGTCVRDFIHVSDLAEAHGVALEALLNNQNQHRVYNLGTGHGHSLLQLTQSLEKILDKKIHVEFKERREGDPASLIASGERFNKEFNWRPSRSSLDNLFKTARDWMKKDQGI